MDLTIFPIFLANYAGTIILAIVIYSHKDGLTRHLVTNEEQVEPKVVSNGVTTLNTLILAYASALNAYAYLAERSSWLLSMVGLANLTGLLVTAYLIPKHREGRSAEKGTVL